MAAEQDRATDERATTAEGEGTPPGEAVAAGREEGGQERLAELEQEVEALKDQVLRAQAELVNFRRRTVRDREDHAERTRADVLRELLPIVDDFDRAVGAEAEDLASYRQGVEMILKSLHDLLTRFGVERVDPLGERFDPHLHEAVERVHDADVESGRVVAVYQPGYRLGDRLLRPARVVVSAGAEPVGRGAEEAAQPAAGASSPAAEESGTGDGDPDTE